MKRLVAVLLPGLAVAGCTGIIPGGGPAPLPAPRQAISYETGPCFGACPVFSFTVRSDGTGVFDGKRFTAVAGTRGFRVTPEQFRAFAAALAPYRPASGELRIAPGTDRCAQVATDLPSTTVHWTGERSAQGERLHFYHGCDMEQNARMADALGNAPDLLPTLEPLIGPRP